MLLNSFWTGFAIGGAVGIALSAIVVYFVIAEAYKDAEKAQVYKPSTKVIIEQHEIESFHRN